ncbi:MAG: 5'/3'-nucleotidase SurE [Muribaculaceae bacterium]|nr:5'/3'-nucleotidase SurE [Muribaculaceae bacterium]
MTEKISRPLILVSNDDGITAKGVHELVKTLQKIGDVVCVCPDSPQSGMSMALTVNSSLKVQRLEDYEGARMYKVTGTPVDCIKMGVDNLLERKPDIVVSGINHGSNAAINVVYSGTMGAAFEGCAYGIPSVGFSLTSHDEDADFTPCLPVIEELVCRILKNGLPEGVCLNVNMPANVKEFNGLKVTKSCKGRWNDRYVEYRDPANRPFYWLAGEFVNEEPDNKDTDEWCLTHGYVSVVPVMLERTYPELSEFSWIPEKI